MCQVLAIIDHHEDGQLFPKADPRVIEMSASCTSLVSRLILDYEEKRKPSLDPVAEFHGPFPRELVDLLLRAIALDSDGLKNLKKGNVDRHIANRLLPRSSWKGKSLMKVMDQLDGEMGTAKRDLSGLSLRDLLRRDWKGDDIETKSERYPTIALGFASTSVSMDDQIKRTPEATAPEWFAIERAFTAESGVDVSIALNSFRDAKGVKTRGSSRPHRAVAKIDQNRNSQKSLSLSRTDSENDCTKAPPIRCSTRSRSRSKRRTFSSSKSGTDPIGRFSFRDELSGRIRARREGSRFGRW